MENKRVQLVTIGTAATRIGVSASTLRLYEKAGKITPARTETGLRLYSPDQIERLREERAQKKVT